MKSIARTLILVLALCSACNKPAVTLIKTDSEGQSDTSRVTLNKVDGVLRLTLSKEECKNIKTIEIYPDFSVANAGDKGFFLLPNGLYTEFNQRNDCSVTQDKLQLALFGSSTPKGTYLAIIKGMRFETSIIETVKDGQYIQNEIINLENCGAYEDAVIDWYPLKEGADYCDMARIYREYQQDRGQIRPLKEKIKENPYLAYAAQAPEIRIRMGWKPAPAFIAEQTLENEPPMHVAVTFDRVKDIIDSLKGRGVDKAEICLVGWNVKGHDGRWPTAFPVEETLGGETKLRSLISYAQEKGYQIVCHSNSGDCYTVSPDLDTNDIAKNPDGSRQKDAFWSGGQMYHLCYKQAWEKYVPATHDKIEDLGFKGIHYIDVLSVVYPTECYDKNHPVNRVEATDYALLHLKDAASKMGGVASEGGFDHLISVLDYVLYDTFLLEKSERPAIADEYVPIWNIVYNGFVLNNCSTVTVNYTAKSAELMLKAIEYGSRPSFYIYSKFTHNGYNWMGNDDLRCGTEEELSNTAEAIYKSKVLNDELGYLQYEFMEKHCRLADDVFRTTWSDGSEVVCNYGSSPYTYKGLSVEPMSYKLFSPQSTSRL